MSDWRENLPEELQVNPTIKSTETIESMAKQLVDAQAYMGQSLKIPGEQAGDDDWKAFNQKLSEKVPGLIPSPDLDNSEQMEILYSTLGKPEKSDDYKVAQRDVPAGVELNNAPIDQFRGLAHKAGLNQKQFDSIVEGMTDEGVRGAEAEVQAHNESHRSLNSEWGLAADDRKKVADKTKREFFPSYGDINTLPVDTVKGLYNMGATLGEEATGLSADIGSQVTGSLSPGDASMQLAEIGGNKKHPYWNNNDPAHNLWTGQNGKYIDLMKQAYPEKK